MAAVIAGVLIGAVSSEAQTGGSAAPGAPSAAPGPPPPAAGGRAKLTKKGLAIPPAGSPAAVQNAINAGNAIHKLPYRWGGGHASFLDSGYDCSGAVSVVLNAAGMLPAPLTSGGLMSWGEPGKGAWITVLANRGHTYAVIAGLRWDTSAVGERLRRGSGPRWRRTKRKPKGYAIRHFPGY